MSQLVNPELLALKRRVIEGMTSYMKFGAAEDENDEDYDPEFDAGYTQSEIDQCDKALTGFLFALLKTPADGKNEFITQTAKSTVLRLNEINNNCGGSLIETDQREDICKLIITATRQVGLVTEQQDITEEWRDW